MNIEHLREFIEIGLDLNLSKAARILHISQSSLSKHITALEQECQVPLLKRKASRIELTAAGRALFEDACDLVKRHDDTVKRIRSYKDVRQLRVGGLYDSGRIIGLINQAVGELAAKGTTVSISYQNYRHMSLAELIDSDKIDLAITILADSDEVNAEHAKAFIGNDPMVCLVDKSHPFSARCMLSITDLEGQTIWQPVGSHSTEHGRSTVADLLERYQVHPIQKPVFVHSITELTTVPPEGGLFIMEKSMLDTQAYAASLTVLPFVEDDVTFSFYALWKRERADEVLNDFIGALASCAKTSAAAQQ